MRFAVLGSGSKGNALVVQANEESGSLATTTTILIDCGLAPRTLQQRLASLGLEIRHIQALCITHGHGDHIASADKIASGYRIHTYATDEAQQGRAARGGFVHFKPFKPDVPFQIGALTIHPFSTPHDSPGSVGFVITDGKHRLGICTDLGYPAENVVTALQDLDILYLEFNYDDDMLRYGPYPSFLKERILSNVGHLSNQQAASLLARCQSTRLRRVLLAHLSENNNNPYLALDEARRVALPHLNLAVAPQHQPTPWMPVTPPHTPAIATSQNDDTHTVIPAENSNITATLPATAPDPVNIEPTPQSLTARQRMTDTLFR